MTSVDLINEDIARLEAERSALLAERAPIDAALTRLHKEIEKLAKARRALQKDDFVTLLNDYDASVELRDLLARRFGGAHKHGVYTGGYNIHTMQQMLRIEMDRGGNVDAIEAFLKEALPHITPTDKASFRDLTDPVKIIDIFENSLSSGGSYNLVTTDDETFYIYCGRWRESTYPTLRAALERISKYHWIRDPRDDN
jgi:hypothetical protein